MKDIFFGYIRNYHSFRLRYTPPWTNWTNKILGYFDTLGTMFGAEIKYEFKHYDLSWFHSDSDEVWLHVEHENYTNWEALDDTIRKIDDSESENLIAIVYPESEKLWNKFLSKLERKQKRWTEETDILAILDGNDFQHKEKFIQIKGYLFSNQKENAVFCAEKRQENKTGYYYAYLASSKSKGKN